MEKLLAANGISKQFANLFSSYAQAFNKKYGRKGSLFMKNFKHAAVSSDGYFSKIIHYIHANPVHHGFVSAIQQWRWSSYNAFLTARPTKINRDEILRWFGGKGGFIKFHQQPVYLKDKDMFDD